LAYSWSAADDASFRDPFANDDEAPAASLAVGPLSPELGQRSLASQRSTNRVALFTESLQAARRVQRSNAVAGTTGVATASSAAGDAAPEESAPSTSALPSQAEWEAGAQVRRTAFATQIEAAKQRMRASCERAAVRSDTQVNQATTGITVFVTNDDDGGGSVGSESDSDGGEPLLPTRPEGTFNLGPDSSGAPFVLLREAFFRDLDNLSLSVAEARESHRHTLLEYQGFQEQQ
jgi:hypothetical protein